MLASRDAINSLTKEINQSALSWDGSMEIQGISCSSTILELTNSIENFLSRYSSEEKSLQGRICTYENLSLSLRRLSDKVHKAKNWPLRILSYFGIGLTSQEKILWPLIKKVDSSLDTFNVQLTHLYHPNCLLRLMNLLGFSSRKWFEALATSQLDKIKGCAFRLIRYPTAAPANKIIDHSFSGASQFHGIQMLQDSLNHFFKTHGSDLSKTDSEAIQHATKLLKKARNLALSSHLSSYLNKFSKKENLAEARTADIAFSIETMIDNLSIGDHCLIPGGYYNSSKHAGHGISYEIKRTSPDKYEFAVFNTGEGADRGFMQAVRVLTTGKTAVPIITNLSKQAISNPTFLRHLVAPMSERGAFTLEDLENQIYSDLQSGIQSTRETHEIQSWGTCAFECVFAFLEYKLSPALFRLFTFHMMKMAKKELDELETSDQINQEFSKEALETLHTCAIECLDKKRQECTSYFEESGHYAIAAKLLNEHPPDLQARINEMIAQERQKWWWNQGSFATKADAHSYLEQLYAEFSLSKKVLA